MAKADFVDAAKAALVQQGVDASAITSNDADFSLTFRDGVSYLTNVYREFNRSESRERDALLRAWAEASAATEADKIPETFADAREHLMPSLRPASEEWFPNYVVRDVPYVDRPFSEDLVVSLVLDYPKSSSRLPASALADWNVTASQAWEAALHNLRQRSADSWEKLADGYFRSTWNDVYDATRILLPDLLYRTGVSGRPLVMIPDRNVLLVTGDREPGALEHLLNMGLLIYDGATYRRSPIPFVLDGETLLPCSLPGRLKALVDARLQAESISLHAAQTEKLQPLRDDVFVGIVSQINTKSGAWSRTYTTWSSVKTLLPVANLIWFSDPNLPKQFCVPWDDVMSIVGPLAADPTLRPVRYYVESLPDATKIEALMERAVDLNRYLAAGEYPPF